MNNLATSAKRLADLVERQAASGLITNDLIRAAGEVQFAVNSEAAKAEFKNVTPAPQTHSRGYQERVAAAHHALFHDDPTDIEERRNRFAEEVNETLQAFGMTEDEAIELVRYTWSRPVGQPEKEVGAALLTLASLCVVAGIDMAACGEADLEKLQRTETIARIRAKRSTRHGRGPLPGFDPALATEGKNNG